MSCDIYNQQYGYSLLATTNRQSSTLTKRITPICSVTQPSVLTDGGKRDNRLNGQTEHKIKPAFLHRKTPLKEKLLLSLRQCINVVLTVESRLY